MIMVRSLDKYSEPEQRRMYARLHRADTPFAEIPVDVSTFLDSPDYLDVKGEVWPANRQDLIDLFSGRYDEAVFDEAIGCGKSYKSSLILAYQLYRLLCLRNPQKYFRLARGSKIALINMSRTSEQAKDVVFGELLARVKNSPWFQKYAQPDETIKSRLRFPKNIIVFPGNSKSTFPLGYNIFTAIMDEAAWYTDNKNKDAAEDMYYVLQRRIRNRFTMTHLELRGLLVMISNPRYIYDFIERKYHEAKIDPDIFARRRAIWEAKPADYWSGRTFGLDGHDIPVELQKDFQKDRAKAWRDHGAKPSMSLEPYFRNWDFVERCFKRTGPFREDKSYRKGFKGVPRYKYHIHFDLALNHDSAGVAMAHKDKRNKIVVDFMLKVEPPGNGRDILLSDLRKFAIRFRDDYGFNIKSVSYDGFQSADSRQILASKGFKTELLSVDKSLEIYDTFKDLIYDDKVEFFPYQPFRDEMQSLELVEGKRVDHPVFGSKDVADAVASVVFRSHKDRIFTGKSYALIQPD